MLWKALRQNQREVVRIDPDDAKIWIVGVVSGHVLQDLQELVAVWERQEVEPDLTFKCRERKYRLTPTWIFLLGKRNNMYSIHVVLLEMGKIGFTEQPRMILISCSGYSPTSQTYSLHAVSSRWPWRACFIVSQPYGTDKNLKRYQLNQPPVLVDKFYDVHFG